MVQQSRQEKPLDSCVIAIESVTRNPDEERMTFGSSVEKVKRQAEQFLAKDYGCNHKIIRPLMQQAKVEHLSPWCSSTEKHTRPK